MARHFAGMTGMAMEERFSLMLAKGPLAQPVLKGSLASLEGEIRDVQAIGTHLVYLVEIKTSSSVQKVTGLSTLNAVSIQ